MKVILMEDMPGVGHAGEAKEVADGYGRNYLIPRKLALLANPAAISILEAQSKLRARQQAENQTTMLEIAGQLDGQQLTIKAKAGANERLFGSITNADIAAEIEKVHGLVVDKKKVELTEPIRQLGSYEVSIKLATEIIPKLEVIVSPEESD